MNYGPNTIGQRIAGAVYSIFANLRAATFKPGGVTIDWNTVPPISGTNAKFTITVTGIPTAGTFSYTDGGQTATWAYNASPDTVEAALEALSSIGNGNVRVTGVAGSSYVIEYVEDLRRTARATPNIAATSLTGATAAIAVTQAGSPNAAVTLPGGISVPAGEQVLQAGDSVYKLPSGRYGLVTSATTLLNGETFVVARHYFKSIDNDQIGEVANVGDVIAARLRVGGPTQPTLANLLAACPGLRPLKD